MRRRGTAATPSAALNGAFTTRRRNTRPDSPSWRAGPISGSASWAGPTILGPPPRRDAHPARPTATATTEQVRRLVGLLPGQGEVPLFVFDAGYDPIAIGHDLADVRCETLTRIRDDRVFYEIPRLAPTDPRNRRASPAPRKTVQMRRSDDLGQPDEPRRVGPPLWHRESAGLARSAPRVTVAGTGRITGTTHRARQRDPGRGRTPAQAHVADEEDAVAVLVGTGRARSRSVLARLSAPFRHRAHLPLHQGHLGWTTPSLCTPEQADRWSWLIVAAYTQLRLARGLVEDLRLPWERHDPEKLTPARVRRGFRRLRATIGTPASPPKSTTPGPGRPKGTRKPPRKRYPAVKKAA